MKKFRVALLANLKVNAPHFPGMASDQWDDLDSEKTVKALVDAICAGGHTCEFLEGDVTLFETVQKIQAGYLLQYLRGAFRGFARSPSASHPGDAAHPLHGQPGVDPGAGAG